MIDLMEKYDWIGEFHQGVAIVKKNEKFGAIMVGGKEIIPPIYDALNDFENGYTKVKYRTSEYRTESKIINLSGQIQVKRGDEFFFLPAEYEWGSDFVGNACIVRKNGKPGLIDIECKIIIPIGQYDYMNIFSEELIEVANSPIIKDYPGTSAKWKTYSNWGIIDTHGKTIIPCCYSDISIYPSEESYIVSISANGTRHYGVVDKSGLIILPFNYSYLGKMNSIIVYSNNAHVKMEEVTYCPDNFSEDSDFGLMDSSFIPLTEATYKIIEIKDECIIVRKNNELGIMNLRGEVIVEFGKYDYVEFDESGLIKVAKGVVNSVDDANDKKKYSKWGVINTNGEEIAFCWYSAVSIVDGQYILACQKIPIDKIYDGREFEDEEDLKYYNWVKGSEDNPCFGAWEIINKEGDTIVEDVEGDEFVAQDALESYLDGSIPDDIDSQAFSYSKYGRYNGWDDDSIDEAFDGDPELTWNVD